MKAQVLNLAKPLFFLIALVFCSYSAEAIYIRPVKLNWPMLGVPPPCVPVDHTSGIATYSVQIRVSDEILPTDDPIYVVWEAETIYETQTGVVGPFEWSDFSWEMEINGINVYWAWKLIQMDLETSCNEGNAQFIFDLSAELVTFDSPPNGSTSGAIPYPISSYSNLFPISIYDQATIDEEEKSACCLNEGGQPDGGQVMIDVNDETGIFTGNNVEQRLQISPNPFTNNINVELPLAILDADAPLKINVFDINGRLIDQMEQDCCEQSTLQINTAHLPQGTYFWHFQSSEYAEVVKMVKL